MTKAFTDHPAVRVHHTGEGSVFDVLKVLSCSRQASESWKQIERDTCLQAKKVKLNKGHLTPVASDCILKQIAAYYLAGARLPIKRKQGYIKQFGLPSSVCARQYVEQEVVPHLMTAFSIQPYST